MSWHGSVTYVYTRQVTRWLIDLNYHHYNCSLTALNSDRGASYHRELSLEWTWRLRRRGLTLPLSRRCECRRRR